MPDPFDHNPFPDPHDDWYADRHIRCAIGWAGVCLVVAAGLLVAALLI